MRNVEYFPVQGLVFQNAYLTNSRISFSPERGVWRINPILRFPLIFVRRIISFRSFAPVPNEIIQTRLDFEIFELDSVEKDASYKRIVHVYSRLIFPRGTTTLPMVIYNYWDTLCASRRVENTWSTINDRASVKSYRNSFRCRLDAMISHPFMSHYVLTIPLLQNVWEILSVDALVARWQST